MSDSVWPHRRQPTRLPCPWDSPGKNTGVGCHFLLQCTKVKRESEVAQSCPTLSDPMDCSLPGSSIHGIFQARVLEWGAIAFSVIILRRQYSPNWWTVNKIPIRNPYEQFVEIDKLVSKIYMELQGTQNSQKRNEYEEHLWRFTLADFKTCYKATVIKTRWYCH